LVVDADERARGETEARLRAEGFAVSTAPDSEAAVAAAIRDEPDVVLTDLHMPGASGLGLCQKLREIDGELPVIIMAGSSEMQSVIEGFRLGAEDCLVKPLQYDALRLRVESAIARRAAKAETESLYRTLNQRLVLSSIREREHAEATAQQHAQRGALLERLSEGVVIADASGAVLMVNGAARAILGVGGEDVGAIDAVQWRNACDREGRPLGEEQRPVLRALRGEEFEEYEVLRVRPDGERRHIVTTGTSVKDDHGNVALAIVVFRDVTEVRRLEQQRRELEAAQLRLAGQLAGAVESVEDGFAVFDEDDRLFLCNGVYRHLLGGSITGPLVGMSFEELVDVFMGSVALPDEAERARFRQRRLAARRHIAATRFDVRMLDGRNLRVVDRPTADGGLVETIWDLTPEVRLTEELREARRGADAASAAKSEFLSSMSHELRTPLNAILGFAQLLRRDKKEPLATRHIERLDQILKGGEHLLRLIEDILDLSRIEARGVSISTEPVSTAEVLDELQSTLEPMAAREGIRMDVEAPQEVLRVTADRTRFAQILLNFGTNAIKYNRPAGTVTFVVSRPRFGRVLVTVKDTGVGIPADKQATIFQPFQRAGQETGPIPGTGIGLVITKRLAEMMGATVGFRSAAGEGSEFWLELPEHGSGAA
jgi:PAS domain S-box-containing protein